MDRATLDSFDKETLIRLILSLNEAVEALRAENAELRAKLDLPPKTPDNSSTPPSRGQKPSATALPKPKIKAHPGAHRPLHPNPASRRNSPARLTIISKSRRSSRM